MSEQQRSCSSLGSSRNTVVFRVQCPVCSGYYVVRMKGAGPDETNPDGTVSVLIRPDQCKHEFVAYVDTLGNARSAFPVHDLVTSMQFVHEDPLNLLGREKDLLEKHNVAIENKDQILADKLWKELKKVRHQISEAGLDI